MPEIEAQDLATGADITPKGNVIAIRSYGDVPWTSKEGPDAFLLARELPDLMQTSVVHNEEQSCACRYPVSFLIERD